MKEKMMRIIVAVMLTLLLCSLTLLAGAASKNDWKNTAGCYVWTESSQYNNGVLNIKPMGDDKYLYELKVMRGSEEEDSAEDFVTAGVFEINEDGDGIAEVDYQNNDTVELRFVLKDKSITAYQDGPLPLDVQGEYRFNEDSFDVSEAAAAALLAGLPEKQTGLPEDVDDYKLLYAEEPVDGWFYQLTALDDEGKVIAKFLVAADLSAVYRNDKEDEVSLIYGDPINMLAAKRAPLVEEDELEGPAIESGELEGDEDAPDLPATAASELSPLVTVAPEEASLKVGERTRIVASLPGCVGYNVTDLRSSNSDIVKVDGDVQLLAVKPGTATISGKLLLEKGEKAFMTQITAYEPKLEAPNLPAHLEIDEALKLEAYVVGEADGVTPEWSVSDEKIAVIEDGKLIGKADGVVTVTAVHGEMKSQWPVAVGTAELPAAEDEEEKEQAPLTLTDIASVLSDSGLSEEQTAVIEKTYEDTFGEDLPSAKHLVDPKLVEANAKRKEKLELVEQVESLKHQLEETRSIPVDDSDDDVPAVKTYDVILRVKPEKVEQIHSDTINGQKCLIIPMDENEHAAVNGVNTTI